MSTPVRLALMAGLIVAALTAAYHVGIGDTVVNTAFAAVFNAAMVGVVVHIFARPIVTLWRRLRGH